MKQEINSPKIYMIRKDGKFYNIKEKQWCTSVLNATFDKNSTAMRELLKFPRYEGCSLHMMTERDFMEEMCAQTTNIVIAGEYFQRLLSDLNSTIPTISKVNKLLYLKCKNAIEALFPITLMQREFLKREEDQTDDVQGHYGEYIHEMSSVQIYEMAEMAAIVKAYHKDKKAILGITKRILEKK